ncbi:hypothetical protein HaLaN_15856 [Haematococcus lacustris]|uniref:Uncharacterized protein n=1 Tax=Haematococcus lacustris TaxID=44745 RepID=A0A699ZSQ9_HAELA|nr:hypothetical protein HaLaN_15856 [Haematococcus lacustris]
MVKRKRKGSAKENKGPPKKLKASRSRQGKQRQERRDGWCTSRRQVKGRPRLVCPRTVCVPASCPVKVACQNALVKLCLAAGHQGPGWRCAARLQEDPAEANGAPPAAG